MSVTWDDIRTRLQDHARENGEWAGIPMLATGAKLVVEPSYPYSKLNGAMLGEEERDPDGLSETELAELVEGWSLVNAWHTEHRGGTVQIYRHRDGRLMHFVEPQRHGKRLDFSIRTMGAIAETIDPEAEYRAVMSLNSMISKAACKSYWLTGQFLETSPRSKITYLFRKLRPTIALSFASGNTKALCALCLHPIAYYEDTWGGAMCPTDDVIAHLTLMRGDEHRYWKKANQHPLWAVQSGV